MISFLQSVDTALFVFVNQSLANPLFDVLMPLVTNGRNWVLAVALALVIMFYHRKRESIAITIGLVLVFALCDQAAAHWIKPLVQRVRPCHVVDGTRVLIGCSGAFAFPSAHAANTFGCAVWLQHYFPQFRWVFFGLSILVSCSRVYVGVHYPFDILGGWLLGTVIALGVLGIAIMIQKRRASRPVSHEDRTG